MNVRTLIVPGYNGSDEHHWQTWLETQLSNCQRVNTIEWDKPIVHNWAREIVSALDAAVEPALLVAHSFGCLASVIATEQRPKKVAGIILVAPAAPDRFGLFGRRENTDTPDIARYLPDSLKVQGMLVGSRNDPWMNFKHAWAWSKRWNLTFVDAGMAGHINSESGHGRWPLVLQMVESMQDSIKQRNQGNPAMLSYPKFEFHLPDNQHFAYA